MKPRELIGRPIWQGVIGAVIVAVCWEFIPRLFKIPTTIFPPFHAVARSIIANRYLLWQELSFTALASVIAWIVAVMLAGGLACTMKLFPAFETVVLYPFLSIQNIPKVAIAPLIVIWLGHGMLPIVALGVLVSFFPILEGYRVGLSLDRTGIRSIYGPLCKSKWKMLTVIYLPEAMPSILRGLRVGMSFATVGVIVGELGAPDRGLGRLIADGSEIFKYDLQFAAVATVCVMGLLLYGLVVLLEQVPKIAHYNYSSSSIAIDS